MRQIAFPFVFLISASCLAGDVDMSAYGFEIGRPLSLPECPRIAVPPMKNYVPPYAAVKHPCLKPSSQTMGQIAFPIGMPARHAAGGDLGYGVADGLLEVIVVPTAGAPVQTAVFDDLIAKYGPPTTKQIDRVVSGAGAAFDAIRASWQLGSLRVIFVGADGRIDSGRILIGTPSGVERRSRLLDQVAAPGRKL